MPADEKYMEPAYEAIKTELGDEYDFRKVRAAARMVANSTVHHVMAGRDPVEEYTSYQYENLPFTREESERAIRAAENAAREVIEWR